MRGDARSSYTNKLYDDDVAGYLHIAIYHASDAFCYDSITSSDACHRDCLRYKNDSLLTSHIHIP